MASSSTGGINGKGSVFSLPISGGVSPTLLASFDGTDGATPSGRLTVIGGTLYGTTQYGSAPATMARSRSLPLGGGTPTLLASFPGDSASAGGIPMAGLTLVGNTFYGTSFGGTLYSGPGSGRPESNRGGHLHGCRGNDARG